MATSDPTSPIADGLELPEGVTFLAVQWVDIHGSPKAKLVPPGGTAALVGPGGGAGFAGFANHGFARGPEHAELLAVPDLDTMVTLPHRPDTAIVLSKVHDGDAIASCCTRSILARVQDEAAAMGIIPMVGMEPEFFLLRRLEDGSVAPLDPSDVLDKPCYDFATLLGSKDLLGQIVAAVDALGIGVYALDHEDGNGQYEINFDYAEALVSADRFTMLRTIISDIARSNGAIASFMPKPLSGRTGSGAHVHLSGRSPDGDNLFLDPLDPRGLGLSEMAYSFIAGVLEHGRALAALTMPSVNSYRRLQASTTSSGATWAPTSVVYGGNNRTPMIRVPAPGRFEDRAVDSSCNPYLALSGIILAGLDGVRRGLDPGAPVDGLAAGLGAPQLPRTLAEALDALERDTVLRDGLGEEALCEFVAVKRMEWVAYMDAVSRWEIDTYLTRV
jgi:glutamine synthetase